MGLFKLKKEDSNMFKDKKFKFFFRLIALSMTSILIGPQNSYGLDLTIDLPLNAGKAPILYYNSTTSSTRAINSATKPKDTLPPPPEVLMSYDNAMDAVTVPEVTPRESALIQDKNFPELACLKDNVDFWEKVYSEIDLNEGIVHDRNNLGRVYAVVNIPRGGKAKSIFLHSEKKLIGAQLISLANKIRSQEILNKQDKLLAKLFSKRELTYKTLMQASLDIRIQTGLKSQFNSGIQRSMNYMSVVFPIVKRSGLPLDLAYLPHVESSYNSRAGSKVGALGLWQLMPSTMRSLEGREAVYKRTDPSLSTKAAMKLLKMNYEKTGSWPLALTAYNHGANGVARAIQETNSHDLCKIIEHYDSPSFKFASSNFYAQFLAARKVAMRKYKVLAVTQKNSLLKQNLLTATGGALR